MHIEVKANVCQSCLTRELGERESNACSHGSGSDADAHSWLTGAKEAHFPCDSFEKSHTSPRLR